jgi:hypothetical protein
MTQRLRFQWNRLVVTVTDDRPQSEVSVAGGLTRAVQILRRRRATVDLDAVQSVVRFYPGWWSEKWMWAVADRAISVVDRNGRTSVEVRASMAPLAIVGVIAAAMVTIGLPPLHFAALSFAPAALAFIVMAGGNYAIVHAAMKGLLRDTLSPPEHWSSFEASDRRD